jgi:hypothetical protein
MEDLYNEIVENLRDWFSKSKSKGGKPGWVQVVSGKPCARQPGQKSTPKCVSSAKRASMSKKERESAQRRKRDADPGQPQKSGAAKPTYVSTDKKKKKKSKKNEEISMKLEQIIIEELEAVLGEKKKKKKKKKAKRDACYHKVKSRYKVWPSAYASGALVKCRKVGAKNWGNSKKEHIEIMIEDELSQVLKENLTERCEKGYKTHPTRKTKEMYGKTYRNCVKAEGIDEEELIEEVDEKELKKISDELAGASKMHKGQSDRIKKLLDKKEDSSDEKVSEGIKNCGCGQSPCKTYGEENKITVKINKIIDEELQAVLDEKKKKKACKPSKGKRFAKRVNGKCRSFGQKGQAKSGGDRIRPGTAKGDAYCARSAKIKKCKNPPCANALSRKKWKCRGSKSMKE